MAKSTSIKEALTKWEAKNNKVAVDAQDIQLQFQWPPLDKMDGSLSTLVACEKLSLSTNMIDKIQGIAGMKSLKILALGRNYVKTIAGLETVSDTLEELWISYNLIDKLKGIGAMKKLRVLYMAHNLVSAWGEIVKIADCPSIREIIFVGNPIYDSQPDEDQWRKQIANKLPQITKLDAVPLIRD